ncbi:MAG: hypothetical protein LUC37_02870 [Prevotella sp.]|nr:hypothetical protein [Prevotella sp.]
MFELNEQFKEIMSLATLKKKLDYMGGEKEESRMQEDKLRTLKKALLYSYQAATAILEDGREFRCLINDNKLSGDYDNKILSIPYKDICLNSDRIGKTTTGEEEIGLKCGDVFEWKETATHWLVYLEYLEEDAYFRAQIRRCDVDTEINNHHYWLYLRGPVETTIQWNQKAQIVWNDINYSLLVYITKNDETLDFFHRFKKIKIDNQWWEIKAVNPYYGDGIIEVCLGEWYNNEMQEAQIKPDLPDTPDPNSVYIDGKYRVHPYDILNYTICNAEGGTWVLNNRKARFLETSDESCRLEVMTGKSGSFMLSYQIDDETAAQSEIIIESL